MQAPGDSGGPAFINGRIAGVVSYSRPSLTMPPDVDGVGNNTYGEYAVMTSVSAWMNNFITPTLNAIHPSSGQLASPNGQASAQPYSLVLDMAQQGPAWRPSPPPALRPTTP